MDAIVLAQEGSPPVTGDPCRDGAPSAVEGLFRLRAAVSRQCLAVGASTTIGGLPASLTAMADDCVVAGEVWQLIPVLVGASAGSFEVRSQAGDDLDIRMGDMADGTAAVLFQPTMNSNQRFFFRSRRTGVFELAPGHVIGRVSCISSAPPFPSIARCSPSATDQEWQLVAPECE